ncbi:MAG: N-6 DNA methylase [Thermoanaerobaculia bacterium]
MTGGESAARSENLRVGREAGKIWSPIRSRFIVDTPEEAVRQEYLCLLVNEYAFPLEQIEEDVSGADGHVDFVVWRTLEDRQAGRPPLIVVQCKAENGTIAPSSYLDGERFARWVKAKFLVTHNRRETRYWKVGQTEEIENIPDAEATDREINDLLSKLKTFKEEEFAEVLQRCHNIIRNREKKDPAAAFDEIAKILFVKVWVERQLRKKKHRENLFSVKFLETQIVDNPLEEMFQQTKTAFKADKIFAPGERINLKPATGKEIVAELEAYNLSGTTEDVKGIAFERFLGRTFRGEIGQFFTPRPIVRFMVEMVEPREGDVVCDPASGSGGFLIQFFENVRDQILSDADHQYQVYKSELDGKISLSAKRKAQLLREKWDSIQQTLDPMKEDSRLWRLSNRSIYGVDANERMARTSKMNMILHGDGHGGVHHWDGFLNINGIFEGRFDVILTNPPFGANVEPSDRITLPNDPDLEDNDHRYIRAYGDVYRTAVDRVRAAEGQSIASLFELPKRGPAGKVLKIKTEFLFIERCLSLLKPGGRLGIVLPEGVFNNPSLAYVREFVQERAFVRAVVSLPQEAFLSSGTSVKTSLLFLQKFTEDEASAFSRSKAGEGPLFDYPVFMYEAERVGITGTGQEDDNELSPNPRKPRGLQKTCLEIYREFRSNPQKFLLPQHKQ